MPKCIHCNFYHTIPERLRKIEVISIHKKAYSRYCRRVEHDVDSGSNSCDRFDPYPNFHCNRFNYRLHLLQCLNRQKTKMEDCRRCKQAEDIVDVARGRDLYEHFGVNRKIHLPKKKPINSKLRRHKA